MRAGDRNDTPTTSSYEGQSRYQPIGAPVAKTVRSLSVVRAQRGPRSAGIGASAPMSSDRWPEHEPPSKLSWPQTVERARHCDFRPLAVMAAENAAFASGSRKRGRPKSISKCQVEVYIVELAKLIGAFIQEASGITGRWRDTDRLLGAHSQRRDARCRHAPLDSLKLGRSATEAHDRPSVRSYRGGPNSSWRAVR